MWCVCACCCCYVSGFKVPGEDGFHAATDAGYYGAGVYFSEFPVREATSTPRTAARTDMQQSIAPAPAPAPAPVLACSCFCCCVLCLLCQSYCIGYIKGGSKLVLCQVLLGRVYRCPGLTMGAPCKKGSHRVAWDRHRRLLLPRVPVLARSCSCGVRSVRCSVRSYDSHMSPCGKELISFARARILPSYIVHYTSKVGEFKYDTKAVVEISTTPKGSIAKVIKKATKKKVTRRKRAGRGRAGAGA